MKQSQEYDDDEINAEIANLQLLIAYCYHEQNDINKASEYYSQLTASQVIHGMYQKLILQNNALVIDIEEQYEQKEKENDKVKIDSISPITRYL